MGPGGGLSDGTSLCLVTPIKPDRPTLLKPNTDPSASWIVLFSAPCQQEPGDINAPNVTSPAENLSLPPGCDPCHPVFPLKILVSRFLRESVWLLVFAYQSHQST